MLNLRCLKEPIKEKLAEIVTIFQRDIEHVQNVSQSLDIVYN